MSLYTAKELREKRASLATQAEAIVAKVREEKREGMTPEETAQFDKIHADIESLRIEAERLEKHESVQADLAASRGTVAGRQDSDPATETRGDGAETRTITVVEKRALEDRAIDKWVKDEATAEDLRAAGFTPTAGPNGRKALNIRLFSNAERRDQSVGTDSAGGYLVPQGFRAVLEESLQAFGGMRQSRATILRTATGNQLEIPTVDDTGNVGAILAENTAASELDFTFGQKLLDAYKYTSKMVQVSWELLQDSAFDLPSFIGRALGTRIGRITNTHFTTGTGSSQPNGVVTAATSGVTAASATVITVNEVLDLIHSVDPAYRTAAQLMFNDATLKNLKQKQDADGRPIWQPGIAIREPDTLQGFPYVINQDVASIATGTKPILFGDFSKYFIRDVMDILIVRLDERYAEAAQSAFVAFSRHDGELMDAGDDPIRFITMA